MDSQHLVKLLIYSKNKNMLHAKRISFIKQILMLMINIDVKILKNNFQNTYVAYLHGILTRS